MSVTNLVVLRGHLSSPPRIRQLPSGSTLLQLEVTTPSTDDEPAVSVPVVWFDPPARSGLDPATPESTEVIVRGTVRRRFFRAGGATVSRTEVVASLVVPARRAQTARRLLERARVDLAGFGVLDRPDGGGDVAGEPGSAWSLPTTLGP